MPTPQEQIEKQDLHRRWHEEDPNIPSELEHMLASHSAKLEKYEVKVADIQAWPDAYRKALHDDGLEGQELEDEFQDMLESALAKRDRLANIKSLIQLEIEMRETGQVVRTPVL
mgnify:CR=1 FL=1|tara:strand:- start:2902 stop:3243 length:342 start_codon:yes stop_codon:yes gene_type:complete